MGSKLNKFPRDVRLQIFFERDLAMRFLKKMYEKLIPSVRLLCQVTEFCFRFSSLSSPPNKLSQYHECASHTPAYAHTQAKRALHGVLLRVFGLWCHQPMPLSRFRHAHLPHPLPQRQSVRAGVTGVRLQSVLSCCFVETGELWGVSTGDRCGQTSFRRRCTGMVSLRSGSGGVGITHQIERIWGGGGKKGIIKI